MIMKTTIKLGVVIGDDIRTRSRIHEIEKYLIIPGDYVLDFTEVCFISRSFADELVSFVDNYKTRKYRIECVNVAPDIAQLLTIVRANRNTLHRNSEHKNVLQLESMKEVKEYFEAF